MARRDRVPRRKSHNHKRNKNAKLSPFQREQKRTKLANQVPTASTIGNLNSIPHSQRHVFNYLQEKMKRQKEKRAALELERQQQREAAESGAVSTGTVISNSINNNSENNNATATPSPETHRKKCMEHTSETAAVTDTTASAAAAKGAKKSKTRAAYLSLNEELTASIGAALQPTMSRRAKDTASISTVISGGAADTNTPRTIEELIARKKERKHKRKQEARRARVAAELESMEAELEDYVKRSSTTRDKNRAKRNGGDDNTKLPVRDRVNAAFERQLALAADAKNNSSAKEGAALRKRRRAGAVREDEDEAGIHAAAAAVEGEQRNEEDQQPPRQRKRISFDPEVVGPTAAQPARRAAQKKPQDFYELVDVVRYGERVEAPPVFDVVPNRNAAVSRLANQLEKSASGNRGRRRSAASDERHRLLSGAGQLGEQKRLARLGLAPAITQTVSADASAATAAARMSKEEEIKALRDRVMATYQRNRRKEVAERKGVDMRHEFPKFA